MKNNLFAFVTIISFLILTSCTGSSDEIFYNERGSLLLTNVDSEACRQEYSGAMTMLESVSDNKTDNVLFSPLDVMSSLMMLANGSNGESQIEILDFISKSCGSTAKTIEEFNELHQKICNNICSLDRTTKLSLNNAIWVNDNDKKNLLPSFQTALVQNFNADIFSVEELSSKNAMESINQWFNTNTNGLISNFLKETLSNDAKMYLGSSMYFKGQWKSPFDVKNTKKDNFTNVDGSQSMVDMMNAEQKVNAAIFDGGKLIALPFGNEAFKMVVMLPDEGHSFKECITMLKTLEFIKVFNASNEYLTKIKLPKINMENESDISKLLYNLGIKSIFDSETADFSNAFISEKFHMSGMKQVVKFELTEEGASAASATGTYLDKASIFNSAYDGMEFYANKPFMFIIFESSNLVPVLTGVINKM